MTAVDLRIDEIVSLATVLNARIEDLEKFRKENEPRFNYMADEMLNIYRPLHAKISSYIPER